MRLTYDPQRRALTLEHRNLDFEDAAHVFAGQHLSIEDDRRDYGETRWQTIGWLNDNVVRVVWTERDDISMRKCNDRERKRYLAWLDGS